MPALDRTPANRRYYVKHYLKIRARMHVYRTGCKCGLVFGRQCPVKLRRLQKRLKKQAFLAEKRRQRAKVLNKKP